MRVRLETLIGRSDSDFQQHLACTRIGSGATYSCMGSNGFDHLRVDAKHRIERHHRILKDHGDPRATDLTHGGVVEPDQFPALKADTAAHDLPRRIDEAEHRESGNGLP